MTKEQELLKSTGMTGWHGPYLEVAARIKVIGGRTLYVIFNYAFQTLVVNDEELAKLAHLMSGVRVSSNGRVSIHGIVNKTKFEFTVSRGDNLASEVENIVMYKMEEVRIHSLLVLDAYTKSTGDIYGRSNLTPIFIMGNNSITPLSMLEVKKIIGRK